MHQHERALKVFRQLSERELVEILRLTYPRITNHATRIPVIVILPFGWTGAGDSKFESLGCSVQTMLRLVTTERPAMNSHLIGVDAALRKQILHTVDQVFSLRDTGIIVIGSLENAAVTGHSTRIDRH